MKFPLGKKELVAMFMESPLYFDLVVRDRLALLRDHIKRFAYRGSQSGETTLAGSSPNESTTVYAPFRPEAAEASHSDHSARVIVGSFPTLKIPAGT
jgi:hypothetical protein